MIFLHFHTAVLSCCKFTADSNCQNAYIPVSYCNQNSSTINPAGVYLQALITQSCFTLICPRDLLKFGLPSPPVAEPWGSAVGQRDLQLHGSTSPPPLCFLHQSVQFEGLVVIQAIKSGKHYTKLLRLHNLNFCQTVVPVVYSINSSKFCSSVQGFVDLHCLNR